MRCVVSSCTNKQRYDYDLDLSACLTTLNSLSHGHPVIAVAALVSFDISNKRLLYCFTVNAMTLVSNVMDQCAKCSFSGTNFLPSLAHGTKTSFQPLPV